MFTSEIGILDHLYLLLLEYFLNFLELSRWANSIHVAVVHCNSLIYKPEFVVLFVAHPFCQMLHLTTKAREFIPRAFRVFGMALFSCLLHSFLSGWLVFSADTLSLYQSYTCLRAKEKNNVALSFGFPQDGCTFSRGTNSSVHSHRRLLTFFSCIVTILL